MPMSICPSCGHNFDAEFCPMCGIRRNVAAPPVQPFAHAPASVPPIATKKSHTEILASLNNRPHHGSVLPLLPEDPEDNLTRKIVGFLDPFDAFKSLPLVNNGIRHVVRDEQYLRKMLVRKYGPIDNLEQMNLEQLITIYQNTYTHIYVSETTNAVITRSGKVYLNCLDYRNEDNAFINSFLTTQQKRIKCIAESQGRIAVLTEDGVLYTKQTDDALATNCNKMLNVQKFFGFDHCHFAVINSKLYGWGALEDTSLAALIRGDYWPEPRPFPQFDGQNIVSIVGMQRHNIIMLINENIINAHTFFGIFHIRFLAPAPAKIIKIVAGWEFGAALDSNHQIWMWGYIKGVGQRGVGEGNVTELHESMINSGMSQEYQRSIRTVRPKRLEGLPNNIVDIAAGENFIVACSDTGQVFVYGVNTTSGMVGLLGLGAHRPEMQLVPQQIDPQHFKNKNGVPEKPIAVYGGARMYYWVVGQLGTVWTVGYKDPCMADEEYNPFSGPKRATPTPIDFDAQEAKG